MQIIKQSARKQPRLSLILLDWGVRESFHLLEYLKKQTVPRDAFEVILVEYYSGVPEPLRKFESEVDTWILLEMPSECYYHKHLMYNTGVVFSKGEVLMIADSDAMVRPTFVETVLKAFERDQLMVYHLDEFRNARRDLYPFSYPSFEEVLGEGCINNAGGKTTGILDVIDPMHSRNHGACMCARREDVISIGGADEDLTYLGHVCGPYDMTFRLMNFGRRLRWETDEYLYHTWHPGSDGVDNYLGPHDGRNMSTTAYDALCSGRIPPLVENEAIRLLRSGGELDVSGESVCDLLINPGYKKAFSRANLGGRTAASAGRTQPLFDSYRGFDIYRVGKSFYAAPASLGKVDLSSDRWRDDDRVFHGTSFLEMREMIDAFETRFVEGTSACNVYRVGDRFAVVPHALGTANFFLRSHREDPRVVWTETMDEARMAADVPVPEAPAVTDSAPARSEIDELRRRLEAVEVVKEELAALRQQVAGLESALAAIGQQHMAEDELASVRVTNLQRQLADVEAGLTAIYQSRTWRALASIGRLFGR